jgi:SAM-dependent methyltransferase
VLDVGCGEGADAVWLAKAGWDVTAPDVSGVALERAASHARDAEVDIRWVHAGLVEAELQLARSTSCLRSTLRYFELPAPLPSALLAAVAPGGVLLVVHHAGMDTQAAHDGSFDPADYVWPPMSAALLNDKWETELNEKRPRSAPESGAGARPWMAKMMKTTK